MVVSPVHRHFPYSQDVDVSAVSRHFPYSKDLGFSAVSRHFPYSKEGSLEGYKVRRLEGEKVGRYQVQGVLSFPLFPDTFGPSRAPQAQGEVRRVYLYSNNDPI